MGHAGSDQVEVVLGEAYRHIVQRRIQIQFDEPASHAFQFFVNLPSHAVSDRHYHNNRSNTNDNAQHSKDRTAFIAFNIHQGDFYIFPYLCHIYYHAFPITASVLR
jgi:hypothetical protein